VSLETPKPWPQSLCHRCAAPPRIVRTPSSVFILCPLLPEKYPPQPVLRCALFRPLVALLLLLLAPAAARAAPSLSFKGGAVLEAPHYRAVYWGTYWNLALGTNDRARLDDFFRAIAPSPRFASVLQQYDSRLQAGSFDGSTVVSGSVASLVTDADVRALVQAQRPAPGADEIDVVFLPRGTEVSAGGAQSCQEFCGYHDSFEAGSKRWRYIVAPYASCTGCSFTNAPGLQLDTLRRDSSTVILSHEMAETITDPDPAAGWTAADGEEIGDLCGGSKGVFRTARIDGFELQQEWSNADAACVSELPIPVAKDGSCPPGFAAARGVCTESVQAKTGCTSAGADWLAALSALAGTRRRRRR
jgi:hypothetical protein